MARDMVIGARSEAHLVRRAAVIQVIPNDLVVVGRGVPLVCLLGLGMQWAPSGLVVNAE
jgi:hypothetical protein